MSAILNDEVGIEVKNEQKLWFLVLAEVRILAMTQKTLHNLWIC